MSYYQDRWLLFKKETTWGEWNTPDTFPNYLNEWSATTTEGKTEEDVIGGERDLRKTTWLEEGVVARWVQEPVSAKIFEYILGTVSSESTDAPYSNTYSITSQLPSMSIYRGIAPDESGNTISLGYLGMKVDTAEITIEDGSEVNIEVNFAGKKATIPTTIAKPTLDFTQEALAFYHSSFDVITNQGTTIPCTLASGLNISINNNLEARYSSGAGTYTAVEIREGPVEVSGNLTMGGQFNTIASQILNRTDNTIKVYFKKTGSTITITVNNVTFNELPDEISGLDAIEIEYPWTARAVSGKDVIKVVEDTTDELSAVYY